MRAFNFIRTAVQRSFYTAILAGFFVTTAALAAPQTPPAPKSLEAAVTFSEFTDLLREKAAQIPELRPVWAAAADGSPEWSQIYLTGGVVRGLLKWTRDQVLEHGLETARRTPTPGVDQLLIIRNAPLESGVDHDLVAPPAIGKQILAKLPTREQFWEILDPQFMHESASVGGSSIEKIMIRPDRIDDALGGLRDFYCGLNTFHDGTGAPTPLITGHTQTALALRFLRVGNDLDLVPAPGSLERTAAIPARESDRLPWGEFPFDFHAPENRLSWWLYKGLKRLNQSVGQDPTRVAAKLAEAGLLDVLVEHQLNIPGIEKVARLDEVEAEQAGIPRASFRKLRWNKMSINDAQAYVSAQHEAHRGDIVGFLTALRNDQSLLPLARRGTQLYGARDGAELARLLLARGLSEFSFTELGAIGRANFLPYDESEPYLREVYRAAKSPADIEAISYWLLGDRSQTVPHFQKIVEGVRDEAIARISAESNQRACMTRAVRARKRKPRSA